MIQVDEDIIYTADRRFWRAWLSKNFDRARRIWLLYPKKVSSKPCIIYNDAVEEALCFGWIDSTIKTYDEYNRMQRFTPRNSKSSYSQQNKERLKWLAANNLLHPSVQERAQKVLLEEFVFPSDILNRLKQDKEVWNNYQGFSDAYRRIRIAYIDIARKHPDIFAQRLAHFMKKTKQNKMFGYGGIDKYF